MNKGSSRSQSSGVPTFASSAKSPRFFAVDRQPSLFSEHDEVLPGSLNDSAIIRAVLVEAIRKSGKSRESIVDAMSLYTGTEITVRKLNGFTAESAEEYRFPAELDRAFCKATSDDTLLRCRAELAGYRVISAVETELLELGRQYLKLRRASDEIALIEKSLQGVDL